MIVRRRVSVRLPSLPARAISSVTVLSLGPRKRSPTASRRERAERRAVDRDDAVGDVEARRRRRRVGQDRGDPHNVGRDVERHADPDEAVALGAPLARELGPHIAREAVERGERAVDQPLSAISGAMSATAGEAARAAATARLGKHAPALAVVGRRRGKTLRLIAVAQHQIAALLRDREGRIDPVQTLQRRERQPVGRRSPRCDSGRRRHRPGRRAGLLGSRESRTCRIRRAPGGAAARRHRRSGRAASACKC